MKKEHCVYILSSDGQNAVCQHARCLQKVCHGIALESGWWIDESTGEPIKREVGTLLMLVVSELSEALEADRQNLNDDKLPNRDGLTVELADAVIRLFDMAGGLNLDIAGAIAEKLAYNVKREDHSIEYRRHGGKRY